MKETDFKSSYTAPSFRQIVLAPGARMMANDSLNVTTRDLYEDESPVTF